eukprot:TRINITY_DN17857_c0_g1_i1.p2 TRINITY_DN17857_c0_g1~~TRINITY_DN17857_c0_g1_i1.p2  ORF type:complete len:105 (+),score=31.89 TRINITY_DN17857_c0_g1_i1:635-949(+)
MVDQIGQNLSQSQQRAAKAEARVEELEKLMSSAGETQGMSEAHYLAQFASAKMFAAATDAEGSIKKLMAGVETLREVAAALKTLDKLTALPDEKEAEDINSAID